MKVNILLFLLLFVCLPKSFEDVEGFSEEAAAEIISSASNTVDGHETDEQIETSHNDYWWNQESGQGYTIKAELYY